jgi:hypothetical protein
MKPKYYIVEKYIHHNDCNYEDYNVVIEVTKSGGYKFPNFVAEFNTLEDARAQYPKAEYIKGTHDKSLLGALVS